MFVSIFFIFGALIQATMFGELVNLVYQINQDSLALQSKINSIRDFMLRMDIEPKLQEEVIRYIKVTEYT